MKFRKCLALLLTFALLLGLQGIAFASDTEPADTSAAPDTAEGAEDAAADGTVHSIVLSSETAGDGSYSHTATLDGTAAAEYDYTWHADPSVVHDEVKNAPAEYYTGTEPSGDDAVYIAHDIWYYPEVPAEGFKQVHYDDEMEWVYYYPVEEYQDYIWANLPIKGSEVPTYLMHSEEDAYQNAVLHITQPGTYSISGSWHGQILIDLGDSDDTFADPSAVVTVILNGVDVECTVAPSLVFYSVYEADNTWESRETATSDIDISDAGAQVIIADDTVNNFTGESIYRMLKTKYKDEESTEAVKVQKKMRKLDGAFYSYQSMVIGGGEKGNGILNITAGNEGLDTELHLTINGGHVNITSQDDGINVNEDGVSVLTVNGGELHIVAGLGSEGDGVDSNGYLVVNGGTVIAAAKPQSDSGLDSDLGSYVNGGYVVATGSTMDWAESNSRQVTMNLQFAADQASDEAIIVTDQEGNVLFAYDPDKDETTGTNNRGYKGAVISCPEFKVGETYFVYIGGDVYGEDVNGLYDISTVTGFEGAVRQEYTGTDAGGFGPGPGGGPGGEGGGPGSEFSDIEGFTMNEDGTVSITLAAAEEILSLALERNPDLTVTAEEIAAITDMRTLSELLGQGGPGGEGGFPGPGGEGGGPGSEFSDIEGFTMNEDGTVSITLAAAEEILSLALERNPDLTVTAEEIAAITDMRALFDLMFAGGQGGPGGEGGFPGPGGEGGFPGPGGEGGEAQGGEPSVAFFMRDTVNAFSGVADEGTTKPTFIDVDPDKYYAEAVSWAVDQNITKGTSWTEFSPDTVCTRGQIVTFLWRLAGSPAADSATVFSDLKEDAYYTEAVLWAEANGIARGYEDGTFQPDKTITRAEAVTFLYRYSGSPAAASSGFPDVPATKYYAPAVDWAAETGVTTGTTESTFSPIDPCTRGQIVTMLYRMAAE